MGLFFCHLLYLRSFKKMVLQGHLEVLYLDPERSLSLDLLEEDLYIYLETMHLHSQAPSIF